MTEIEFDRPRKRRATIRTDEDTLDLVRRLAQFHSDSVIAAILNRQGKTTAYGHPFNVRRVGNLRRNWNISGFDPASAATDGELVNIAQAAKILGVATSTVHRWLNDGFIDGEQITPGAPWRIRITEAFRPTFMEEAPLRVDVRGHAASRRDPPDRVAACKARRARRHPYPRWKEKSLAHQEGVSMSAPTAQAGRLISTIFAWTRRTWVLRAGREDQMALQGIAAGTPPEVVSHHGVVADVRWRHVRRPGRAVFLVDGLVERLDHLAQEVPALSGQGIVAGGKHGVHLAFPARGVGPDDDGAKQPDTVVVELVIRVSVGYPSCGRRGRSEEV